jgi:N-acetyl-1-D-myo-inositol-2-amino-2-deoxy-alpha-D-glucopyranoside deacetylase
MLDVEAALRGIIADVRPHVIVAFEPHGGYYHPDHVAIQRATTASTAAGSAIRNIEA